MTSREVDFIVGLLDQGGAAYAGLAVRRLFERHPGIGVQHGPDAVARWRQHMVHRIAELATAVDFESPGLFARAVRWSRHALRTRNLPPVELAGSLDALRDVLREELPEPCRAPIEPCFEAAFDSVEAAPPASPSLDPASERHRLALQYVEACLEGNPIRATGLILAAVAGGLSIHEACHDVLVPALGEVGRLWHEGRMEIHEEHTVTAVTHRLVGMMAGAAEFGPPNGKTVVAGTVEGDAHDTMLRMLMLEFEMAGWRAIGLGTQLPPAELADSARDADADLVVISATLIPQLRSLRQGIRLVRERSPRSRILVGGPALDDSPGVRAALEADVIGIESRSVVESGSRLVGLV
ncbi:MAG TPA: cobalamin-dependent protein [Candidatus Eisenbacteria bacterium]